MLVHVKNRAAVMGNRGTGHGIFAIKMKSLVVGVFVLLLISGLARAEAQKPEDNLVLQLAINTEEMTEFIEGLQKNGKVYLPLGQLSALLDFPIRVDADNKTASGWFINDDNRISLTEKTSEVKGRKTELHPDSIIVRDRDLFIDSSLLQKWFPLDFSVDLPGMVLNIATREALPFQEARWRKKMHDKLSRQQEKSRDEKAETIGQAYEALQWPSLDLTFSPTYKSSTRETTANYSALAVGDVGYLTSRLYAAGDLNQQSLSDMRLSFGRDDYERRLLGPARASSFSFGDINAVSLAQATSSGQGRGVTVTNRALDRPDKFDVTSFIGDSKPGWEVELYRNDNLISFQTVGSNGSYEFLDVPVLFGSNIFRLVFYGPQGQRSETVKTINADSSLLEKGEFSYNVSADQKSQSLFGVASTTAPESSSPRMVGELEYGVSRRLTVTAGGARTTVNNTEHTYATTGLHASFGGILTALDEAYDATAGGTSSRLSVSTNHFGTDIVLKQKIARNFISEADSGGVTAQTDLNLNRGLHLPFLGSFGNSLSLSRKTFADNHIEKSLIHRLSKTFLGLSLSHMLEYSHEGLAAARMSGTLTVHGAYKRVQMDAQMDYDLKQQKQFKKSKLTALFPLTEGIVDTATLTNSFTGDKLTELENTVTFDMQRYKLSLTGRVDTKKTWFAGVSVNTAIGKVPGTNVWVTSSQSLATTGTVSVRPFIDRNYNQKLDPGEEFLPGAVVRIGDQSPKANDKGLLIATQLPVNLPVMIKLDTEQQNDPFQVNQSANPNLMASSYRVMPRAGKVVSIDFPLIETSQIDGTVHVPEGSNPAALQVDLITTEGQTVGSTRTAFDGYYLLEGVMPGAYTLHVTGDKLRQTDDRVLVIQAADIYARDMTLNKE